MSDWPAPLWPAATITTMSFEAVGMDLIETSGQTLGNLGSGTWPAANLALLQPFRIVVPTLVTRAAWYNGAAVSGNCDIGIYDEAGTKLISSGSTAQAGTNAIQQVDLTDTLLGAGVFYVAFAMDNITGTVQRNAPAQVGYLKLVGFAQMETAFPLPATVTFATVANAYYPYLVLGTGAAL